MVKREQVLRTITRLFGQYCQDAEELGDYDWEEAPLSGLVKDFILYLAALGEDDVNNAT